MQGPSGVSFFRLHVQIAYFPGGDDPPKLFFGVAVVYGFPRLNPVEGRLGHESYALGGGSMLQILECSKSGMCFAKNG